MFTKLTINIQRLLCTVINLYVVKEAIQSSNSLPFITNFNLFVNAKTLIDFSTYFKDVITYYFKISKKKLFSRKYQIVNLQLNLVRCPLIRGF